MNRTAADTASRLVVPLLINGAEVITQTTFDVVSPVTNDVIWRASSASKEDAIRAVEAAQAAFPAWSKSKPARRRDILLRASEIFASRGAEFAEYMKIETGSGDGHASGFNIPLSIEQLRDVAGRIVASTGHVPVCNEEGKSAMILKEPFGVILGIAPWNAPYILGLRAISYAIVGGNTCILKGSELSPRCFWAVGSIFKEAGLPDGVLNVLFHRTEDAPAITSTLIAHPAIKKINFTGSSATGAIIASQAGKHLKPILMELGGKAPAIVLHDADISKAARGCALGAFLHSGQICMSTERILVHESIFPAFSSALKAVTQELYPPSVPALTLINPANVTKNKSLISSALENGASLLTAPPPPIPDDQAKTHLHPAILTSITLDHKLYHTETFGPTVGILTFSTEEEAIAIANDTPYGLSAAVYTEDLRAGLRIARRIESGAVHINSMSVHDEPALEHGGVKASGWGRFNAQAGIEEFLTSKTVTWVD